MRPQKVLSKEETREQVLAMIERQTAEQYPSMNPHQRHKYARKAAKRVLSTFRNGLLVVESKPVSKFEAFKEKYAPKWLLGKFPVKYMESH